MSQRADERSWRGKDAERGSRRESYAWAPGRDSGARALCLGTGRQQRSILKCGGKMEIFGQVENMQLTRGFQQGSWEVRGLWCVAAVELRVGCNSKDPGKKQRKPGLGGSWSYRRRVRGVRFVRVKGLKYPVSTLLEEGWWAPTAKQDFPAHILSNPVQ